MRISRLILSFFLLLSASLPARAASSTYSDQHLSVEWINDEFAVYAPDEILAGLHFKLEPGWHIYWKNPGDAGEPPRIDWELPKGVKAGPMLFPAPKRLPLGPLMDFGYENEVLFPMTLYVDSTFKPGSTVHLVAKVSWLVCRGSCIPGKTNLDLNIPVVRGKPGGNGLAIPLLKKFRAEIPKPLPVSFNTNYQPSKEGFRLTIETGQREQSAVFFPEDQDILDNPAPQKLTPTANGLILDLKKDVSLTANPTQLKGVLELSGGRNYEIVALPPGGKVVAASVREPSDTQGSGVKAPSDAIAVNAEVKAPASASPSGATNSWFWSTLLRTSGLAFLGGLLLNLMPCVFPVLFLKGLALVNSGNEERAKLRTHGLVYGAGILLSFWALVSALLGLRAAGATLGWGFQFQSPIFLALMAGLLFFLGLSLAGQFEIGLTLTSAGGALAQKQGYTGSFFTGVLAVVVATPCTAPFMGAAIGYALAQSASVTFAVFTALALGLAAPYVALTLQPAWTRWLPRPGVWMEVLRQAVAVPIFITVIWLAWVLVKGYGADLLWILLGSFLLLAIAGWFLGRWPAKRWAATVSALILLSVIALAAFGPRMATKADGAGKSEMDSVATGGWEPWSAEAVSLYQMQGRPVFVDFTASWCLSCQVNERVALEKPVVVKAFQAGNVVLMKADWTRHDEAITKALTALGRSGVPAYALYTPGQSQPRMLPEVLTPGIVIDALSNPPQTAH
jgi:thiol:disulfide interchange protein DsbD